MKVPTSPEEMMASVDHQVRFCHKTKQRHIDCPYCGHHNRISEEALCCQLLASAVEAVLNAMDDEARCDEAKRILDNALEEKYKSRIIQ